MKIAFFKGTKKGLAGIYNRAVRFVTKGKYSHVEIIFSDGVSASSSFMDGGVRFKKIGYDLENWDFLEIDVRLEEKARKWFVDHEGEKYDLLGNVHHLFSMIGDNRYRWTCSEAVAESIGVPEAWRVSPASLYGIVKGFYAIG